MIWDNLVACEAAEKLASMAELNFKQENDNVLFGLGVIKVVVE
jgi:hypothetical protein